MTVAAFRKLVFALARSEGTPYLKPAVDVQEFNDLVQEALDVYTSETHCLQADNITFTPIVGYSSFDTSKTNIEIAAVATTYLSARLCYVRQVVINNNYLASYYDLYDRPGPSSEYAMVQNNQGYLTADDGQPAFWWHESPNTLRFDKAFDQSYDDCFIAGRKYHALYTTNDADLIELASEDIRPAAMLGAAMLLIPNSKEKGFAIEDRARAQMKKRRGECAVKMAGSSQRGTGDAVQTVNMRFGGGGSGLSPRRFRNP